MLCQIRFKTDFKKHWCRHSDFGAISTGLGVVKKGATPDRAGRLTCCCCWASLAAWAAGCSFCVSRLISELVFLFHASSMGGSRYGLGTEPQEGPVTGWTHTPPAQARHMAVRLITTVTVL